METLTQNMEYTTDVEYISIYDKPKRGKGRPKGTTLTEDEKRQRHNQANLKCYFNNHDYYKLQKHSPTNKLSCKK